MKRIVSLLIILVFLISIANAQTVSVGGQVTFLTDLGVLLYGAVGDVDLGNISIRPSVQFGSWEGISITLLDACVLYNLPLVGSPLTPYFGAGFGYLMLSYMGYSLGFLTASGVGGVKFKLSEQFNIFADIRYMIWLEFGVGEFVFCGGAMYRF